MLPKINKLTNWQVAAIITLVGFAVFFTGLNNPFQGDDTLQIVNNIPVHSITNIKLFFEGSTFYTGNGLTPLSGIYYRPLMTTMFSLLYTLFGAHTFYFHSSQLVLYLASAFLLFLIFRYSFNVMLSLILSLIFLVHPLNSQVVFSIPSMQDVLFFFFGALAIWLLMRFKSTRSLTLVALCLFLSLLSKESGILFVVMAFLYLFLFERRRVLSFIYFLVLPIALYLTMKIYAVGLNAHADDGPIDLLNLHERLLNIPSIIYLYLSKFIFPMKLASGYFWAYHKFSISHVLIPLIIDLLVAALVICSAICVRRRVSSSDYRVFTFFAVWATIGLLPYLQIIPLDFTASEPWFYFSMAGILGMIGVAIVAYQKYINPAMFIAVAVVVIGLLGIRTALRGTDYRSTYVLAWHDISASPDDYTAYNDIAQTFVQAGQFNRAEYYAHKSINIFPNYSNYMNLGVSLTGTGDYNGALDAFTRASSYANYAIVYEDRASVTLLAGSQSEDHQFLESAVKKYPYDYKIWMYTAVFDDKYNDDADAKVAITKAATYGPVPQTLYGDIINNQAFTLSVPSINVNVVVK